MKKNDKTFICTSCVMDTTDVNIKFDENGVCERCHQYREDILPNWNYGKGHEKKLDEITKISAF